MLACSVDVSFSSFFFFPQPNTVVSVLFSWLSTQQLEHVRINEGENDTVATRSAEKKM